MRRFWLALFVLVSGVLVYAQDIDIPYQKFVLDNGLTLIVHEDHKAPIVAVNLWYHVGSKNEKAGRTGFAHLFEHLMFGGSQHAEGSYIKSLESVGATDLNGTTNSDRTNFFENVPTSALDYALWMEADRMGFLDLSQKTLDLQRGVVQNEKRQGENRPYRLTQEYIPRNTYPVGHPYSWDVIGEMSDLDAASFKDVQEWFRTYYGPSNVVIVLAGDIDAKTAKEKVEKYFGDIPPGPPVTHQQVWIAKMTGTHREVNQEHVPLPRIYKVWNVPQFGSADADYLDLVSACLGEGKTSRLYKRLVYDNQIASDVEAYNSSREIGGQFYIQATAQSGHNLQEIEKAIDEELARFLREGPSAEELERVRTQYLADFLRGIERIGGFGGKSDRLAEYAVYTGSPDAYKITLKRIREATATELKAAANRWLTDGVFVAEVLPFPNYKATATGVDHTTQPALGTPPELNLPKLQHATLSNGLKLILANRPGLPLVDFWMSTDAGYAADQFAAPGTAKLVTQLLVDGTSKRTALEINDQAAMLGAELQGSSNLDFSYVRLSALKSKLDASLDLFADVVLHPTFPDADFHREQKLQLDGILKEQNDAALTGFRVFPRFFYGTGHAYGNPWTGSGTIASVKGLTRDDLIKFHDVWFRPNNATLVVVGDITLEEITPKLEKLFGGWKPGQIPVKDLSEVSQMPKPAVYIVDKPNAIQSSILVGSVAVPPNTPQEIALQAMNDDLGGTFGSRLNMNLREDKHWTYGVRSYLRRARAQRPFLVSAPVQTDKTKESMLEISRELKAIVNDRPVTSAELDHIRANEILSLPGSRETLGAIGSSITDLLEYRWPDDYYDTMTTKIKALTTSDLDAAAKQVVHPGNLIWVVVGDRSKIEPGIRELGFGEIHIVDADGNSR